MKKVFIHILFLLFSIGVFSLLFFILGLSVILSVIIGLFLFFILSGFTENNGVEESPKHKGNTVSGIDSVLETGFEKLGSLEQKSLQIDKEEIRLKIGRIYSLGQKILDTVRDNPSDYRAARQFFNYYLDATNSILDKYVTLQNNRDHLSIAEDSFQKTENLLDTIEVAYQKQLEKLFEDDVMDLDTELKVLAKTIKSEGF